jgi:Icc-related predicted phosphoesterase
MSHARIASVSTRFLVISDTHNFEFDSASGGAFSLPLPKVDVVLHCGDLTNVGGSSSFKNVLKMLGAIDAEKKLVIAGNHDLDLDKEYWRSSLQEGDDPEKVEKEHLEEHDTAMSIMTGPLAAAAGVTYLEEGTHSFSLKSGARFIVYASPYQPGFNNWAFGYERGEDRFNTSEQVAEGVKSIAQKPVPDFPGVDIMMTHGPLRGILDQCEQGSMGCDNLLRAAGRARPRLYCFGHIHEGYGAKLVNWESENEDSRVNSYPESITVPISFGKETLMVNAAIGDGKNEAVNAPWLIDLDLPCTLSWRSFARQAS